MFSIQHMIDDELRMFKWSSETRRSRISTLIFSVVQLTLTLLMVSLMDFNNFAILKAVLILPILYLIVSCSVRLYAAVILQPRIAMWDALRKQDARSESEI